MDISAHQGTWLVWKSMARHQPPCPYALYVPVKWIICYSPESPHYSLLWCLDSCSFSPCMHLDPFLNFPQLLPHSVGHSTYVLCMSMCQFLWLVLGVHRKCRFLIHEIYFHPHNSIWLFFPLTSLRMSPAYIILYVYFPWRICSCCCL